MRFTPLRSAPVRFVPVDYIHNIRDGLIRKYGHTGVHILDYLHEIGKEMGCEPFQY